MSAFLLNRPLTWFGQNHCLIKQSVHSDSLDVRHSKTLFLRLPNSWSISPHERESGLWNRKIFGFRSFEIQDIRVKLNQQSVACESILFSRLHPRRKTVCEKEPRKNRLAFANGFSRRVKLETWDEKTGCKLSAVSLKTGICGVESRIQNCLGFPPYMGRNDKSIFATEEMNLQCSDSVKITWTMISTKIDAIRFFSSTRLRDNVILRECEQGQK